MSYVIVTADFPDVTTEQRTKIYKCLQDKKWQKITELERDISTVWYASFKAEVDEKSAINLTIDEFVNCSKQYCRVKLVIHYGPNKPTFHGLS